MYDLKYFCLRDGFHGTWRIFTNHSRGSRVHKVRGIKTYLGE